MKPLALYMIGLVGCLGWYGHADAAPILNPANGHYYDAIAVAGSITWPDALTAAASLSFAGVTGHLATITSQSENDFIVTNFPVAASDFYWLGGIQPENSPEPAGNWQWITGEPFIYTNWAPGEPNNAGNIENRLQFRNSIGHWNDLGESVLVAGYVVEFSASIPEPATALLLAISTLCVISMGYRQRKKTSPM